jgi:D-arabinose 1-dehydrogenase-like Zn-dependent alcohol dehydrogenase
VLLSAITALVKAGARQAAAITPLGPAVLGDRREPLDGRVVFMTGAARGLGAELARQAHAEGARVALVGRRLEPLQALAAELGEERYVCAHVDGSSQF